MKAGKYIVIEGHDGIGKSTQVGLIRKKLANLGIDSIEFHEPGGNPIAEAIRVVLKDGDLDRDPMTDILLFSAARCDVWKSLALPALNNGIWVVASRNYYSTKAFQGYGSGLDQDVIDSITLFSTDERYTKPDYAFILDLDNEERIKRISSRGKLTEHDTFESRPQDFQERVRLGYLDIAKKLNLPIISANQSIEAITEDIWRYIA